MNLQIAESCTSSSLNNEEKSTNKLTLIPVAYLSEVYKNIIEKKYIQIEVSLTDDNTLLGKINVSIEELQSSKWIVKELGFIGLITEVEYIKHFREIAQKTDKNLKSLVVYKDSGWYLNEATPFYCIGDMIIGEAPSSENTEISVQCTGLLGIPEPIRIDLNVDKANIVDSVIKHAMAVTTDEGALIMITAGLTGHIYERLQYFDSEC